MRTIHTQYDQHLIKDRKEGIKDGEELRFVST